jgi:hypothetical protein
MLPAPSQPTKAFNLVRPEFLVKVEIIAAKA